MRRRHLLIYYTIHSSIYVVDLSVSDYVFNPLHRGFWSGILQKSNLVEKKAVVL